jgi:hypothetical protein
VHIQRFALANKEKVAKNWPRQPHQGVRSRKTVEYMCVDFGKANNSLRQAHLSCAGYLLFARMYAAAPKVM